MTGPEQMDMQAGLHAAIALCTSSPLAVLLGPLIGHRDEIAAGPDGDGGQDDGSDDPAVTP